MLIEKIKDAVREPEAVSVLTRQDLMEGFPHKGIALVASVARIVDGEAEFTLLPGEFPTYCAGHPWRFPGHWLTEMACQVAGLQAFYRLYQSIGEGASEYGISLLIRNGDWADKPLDTDPNSDEPIVALVMASSFRLATKMGMTSYWADVEFCQGDKTARYEGIRVVLKRSADNNG